MFRPRIVTAYGPARADIAARDLVAAGVNGLVSMGFAGALAPGLSAGQVLIGGAVLDPTGARLESDADWCARALYQLRALAPEAATIVSGVGVLADPAAKTRLYQATGARAVDMESGALAAAAAEAGLPFLAIRVVLDSAARTIPDSALAAISEDGTISTFDVMRALLKAPGDLPALMALALDEKRALRSLRRVARRGLPLFGFV